MSQLSYRRHRFPAEIIQHAIWLHLRFTLSHRDVEEMLAERGLDVSYAMTPPEKKVVRRVGKPTLYGTGGTLLESGNAGRRERKAFPDGLWADRQTAIQSA